MESVTSFLNEIHSANSSSEILPQVYDELRRLAAARLRQLGPGQTLQATALVHGVFLKLAVANADTNAWGSRVHFFAVASEAMRQVVIDQYRRKKSIKRGGKGLRRLDVDFEKLAVPDVNPDLISINEAIDVLESVDPQKAMLVKLKFFGGLTMQEIAGILEVSIPTAERYWRYARAFLARHLQDIS